MSFHKLLAPCYHVGTAQPQVVLLVSLVPEFKNAGYLSHNNCISYSFNIGLDNNIPSLHLD